MPKHIRNFRDAMRLYIACMPQTDRINLIQSLDDQRQHVGKTRAAQIDRLQKALQDIWTERPPVK